MLQDKSCANRYLPSVIASADHRIRDSLLRLERENLGGVGDGTN